jgi:signal transduction histidine kinase
MNNVVKHAWAGRVDIALTCSGCVTTGTEPSGSKEIILTVRDDGRGFDPRTVPPDRLGLNIMRERADGIGAKLTLTSRPDEGVEVRVVWVEDGD